MSGYESDTEAGADTGAARRGGVAAETLANGVRVLRSAELSDVEGLVAGITLRSAEGGGRGKDDDFGLSTGGSAWALAERYERLTSGLGFSGVSVCRQVHGTELVDAGNVPATGLWLADEADGFVGSPARGRLLAVTVADCVPVYLVHAPTRTLALLHAGWRGAAAGILVRALTSLRERTGAPAAELRMHLGPAICGSCYEVGPEVPRAFGREVSGKTTIDVGAELLREAAAAGIAGRHLSRSRHCTRCDGGLFHSHRGGAAAAGRMAAWLGWTT